MTPPSITNELQASLRQAIEEARKRPHEYLTPEHPLLALLDNPKVIEMFGALQRRLDAVETRLEGHTATVAERGEEPPGRKDEDDAQGL